MGNGCDGLRLIIFESPSIFLYIAIVIEKFEIFMLSKK
jgi:hypothetical protein